MPIGSQVISPTAAEQAVAKSIGNSYNLRGSNNGSPTNFNTMPVPNHHKLVRYKNTSTSRETVPAQQL